jgi:hypothetical protein
MTSQSGLAEATPSRPWPTERIEHLLVFKRSGRGPTKPGVRLRLWRRSAEWPWPFRMPQRPGEIPARAPPHANFSERG